MLSMETKHMGVGKFLGVLQCLHFHPVFKFSQTSLVGYGPRGHKESDTTEQLHFLSMHCL